MNELSVLTEMSRLYGESQHDGRRLVHLQAPQVRDHWEKDGELALIILAVEVETFRIVRAYWEIQKDGEPLDRSRPDHVAPS